MKQLVFVIAVSFMAAHSFAQVHKPTWFLMDDRNMSSFDMLTTRTGLIAVDDNGFRLLSRYDSGVISGIFNVSGSVTSIIIADQNTAYFTVKGDGMYQATNHWKDFAKILTDPNPFLLSVYRTNILSNIAGSLYYSNDGVAFHPAAGISSSDQIIAANFYNAKIAFAVSAGKIYRSFDGGITWTTVIGDPVVRTNSSVYCDSVHNAIYIGGSQLSKSIDTGKTWQALSSIFFTLSGAVLGSRDCSGNFYLGPDLQTHGSLYRSVDQGKFFQEAGPAIFASVALKKGVILDRGSTFFWLDSSGLIGVVRDGIDSTISDSVGDHIHIQVDSGIRNSLCNNASATQFAITVSFDQCTGIILDSLKQVGVKQTYSNFFKPGFLNDTSTISIPFLFRASHPGFDTIRYRLRIHSQITGNVEQKFFDIIALGTAGSPDLSFSSAELDFAPTGLDSSRKLSTQLLNSGCDTLVIDTMFSTNPAIFILDTRKYPLHLQPGKSILQTISFNPHLAGDYLESMQIESNIGSRFLTLRGTGKAPGNLSAEYFEEVDKTEIYPNPAVNLLSLRSEISLPSVITMYDVFGRKVNEFHTYGAKTITCDISSAASGDYLLGFGNGKFRRVIIQH